ncbi:M48 family metallopeptidase [Paractinoplanes lichenicola]|uniref:M48 family metallopeptidase n=1 Tax=Paractinoplanes lichenicola TaxID=2802976 RepID=A0ABS1VW36_9ACTN|nr:M48 family metallopeptidase [Actinoplanes lichenicola]MBL7258701.1 M48 family metallopeptidase [Actinoplanes lichenicola]
MTTTVTDCPQCAAPTVALGHPQRWCPACDWNLDTVTNAVFGWRWLDRRLHRVAFRLTAAQFEALGAGRSAGRVARGVTLAAAAILLAGVLALAVLGTWLILVDFFSVLTVLGLVVLAVAVLLRPRFGRLDAPVVLDEAAAPALFGLIRRVAETVDAPVPHVVVLASDLNAYTTTVGVRRRRVLGLGLPLWATLGPQERVALLGHELGHFVNGDVRRGPLTQVAETTLGRVAHLLAADGDGDSGVIGMLTRGVGWILSRTAMALHLLLVWTSQRDSQRAEYLADELGARAGGTPAAVRLADHLLIEAALDTVVRREARAGNGPAAWRAAAVVARDNQAANIPALRKLSKHTEVSLFASHPPSGLRAEMLERRPPQNAAVTLTEPEAERIDGELAAYQERVRRDLVADR